MALKQSFQELRKAFSDLRKPTATATSARNAADWNRPGGGYDQWRKGDAAREKAMPIGSRGSPSRRKGRSSGRQ